MPLFFKCLDYITIMLTSTPWSLLFLIKICIFIFFLKQTNLMSLMTMGCFPPLSLKVPQLLSNLFISVVDNNGVFFILHQNCHDILQI